MKRYILAVILLLASSYIFASCACACMISNTTICAVSGLSSNTADISAVIWLHGSYNATDGGGVLVPGTCTTGCDSQSVPVVDTTCGWMGDAMLLQGDCAVGGSTNDYFLWADWFTPTFDGCPGPANSDRACALIYDTTGQYALLTHSQGFGGSYIGFDDVGTQAAALCSIPTGVVMQNGGPTTVDVTWDNTATNFYGAYAVGDAPASAVLTTFDVWYYVGGAAPTSFVVPGAGWTAGPTGIATSTASTLGMTVPQTLGQTTYMTRRFYAQGLIPLPTASTAYTIVVTPSGAPAIKSVSATHSGLTTTVNWVSGDESQVTGYQVFWAPQGGEFTAVGSQINPAGNDHNYTASVRIPSTSTFSVKVGAFKTNGETEYSAAALVKSANVIKDKTRATVN